MAMLTMTILKMTMTMLKMTMTMAPHLPWPNLLLHILVVYLSTLSSCSCCCCCCWCCCCYPSSACSVACGCGPPPLGFDERTAVECHREARQAPGKSQSRRKEEMTRGEKARKRRRGRGGG